MRAYFADTSAIAKRYLNEPGSRWVLSWILPAAGNVVIISAATVLEMTSLLAWRQQEGDLSRGNERLLRAQFLMHSRDEYLVTPLNDAVLKRARLLLDKHALRTMAALQLASALVISEVLEYQPVFVTSDANLLQIAMKEDFPTDDPNAHPLL